MRPRSAIPSPHEMGVVRNFVKWKGALLILGGAHAHAKQVSRKGVVELCRRGALIHFRMSTLPESND